MTGYLQATAKGLSVLRPSRTPEGWTQVAYQAVRDDGPQEEVEHRMALWLHGHAQSAKASRELLTAARSFGEQHRVPPEVARQARQEMARDGGMTQERAESLGWSGLTEWADAQHRADDEG